MERFPLPVQTITVADGVIRRRDGQQCVLSAFRIHTQGVHNLSDRFRWLLSRLDGPIQFISRFPAHRQRREGYLALPLLPDGGLEQIHLLEEQLDMHGWHWQQLDAHQVAELIYQPFADDATLRWHERLRSQAMSAENLLFGRRTSRTEQTFIAQDPWIVGHSQDSVQLAARDWRRVLYLTRPPSTDDLARLWELPIAVDISLFVIPAHRATATSRGEVAFAWVLSISAPDQAQLSHWTTVVLDHIGALTIAPEPITAFLALCPVGLIPHNWLQTVSESELAWLCPW